MTRSPPADTRTLDGDRSPTRQDLIRSVDSDVQTVAAMFVSPSRARLVLSIGDMFMPVRVRLLDPVVGRLVAPMLLNPDVPPRRTNPNKMPRSKVNAFVIVDLARCNMVAATTGRNPSGLEAPDADVADLLEPPALINRDDCERHLLAADDVPPTRASKEVPTNRAR